MATLTIQGTVRSILQGDIDMPADEVIKKAKTMGLKKPEANIRAAVHNLRSELKRKAAASHTNGSRAIVVPSPAPNAETILGNVSLVNTLVGVMGGMDQTKKFVEAIEMCGGVEGFKKYLGVLDEVKK